MAQFVNLLLVIVKNDQCPLKIRLRGDTHEIFAIVLFNFNELNKFFQTKKCRSNINVNM
jgi:hypothetical protein